MVYPFDSPRARLTDPDSSHAAADTSDRAGSTREVLSWLSLYPDGLTDAELEHLHTRSRAAAGHKPYTGARLRTARAELVEAGRVVAVGKGISPSGRACTRWALNH